MNDITDVKAFALSTAALYIKFLASTVIQGRKAFAENTQMIAKAVVCTLGLQLTKFTPWL
uniref:Uncharacterized protein n=1 Tax=Peronospora matthiolae TaxID=2874970 RepID=A0AAV1UCN7_9STRA